jgi:hypothetical protein
MNIRFILKSPSQDVLERRLAEMGARGRAATPDLVAVAMKTPTGHKRCSQMQSFLH